MPVRGHSDAVRPQTVPRILAASMAATIAIATMITCARVSRYSPVSVR
jgi:hypothetical protein